MAQLVHMTIEGAKQGLISAGCSEKEGREDTIEVFKVEQSFDIPGTGFDGRVSGARVHRPLEIMKKIDRSSPLLANALASNEALTSVTLDMYRHSPSGDGTEEHFYQIVLTNARVNLYKAFVPNIYDRNSTELPPLEEIQFTFGIIKTTYMPDGIIFEDDWNKPRV